ncbi:MAG: hypothetical protein AAB368_10275, partial [bacterium]
GARTAASARLAGRGVKVADPGSDPFWVARITGELLYESGDPLDEVELEVCFLDPAGAPVRVDPRGKPAYGIVFPVLAASVHEDGRRRPLRTGGSRRFSVEVPRPFDEVGPVPVGGPRVRVTWVRFAR